MFHFCWGLARILDLLSITGDSISFASLCIGLLALALMCVPSSNRLFLALAFADLIGFLLDSPKTPNHAVLRAFIDLGFLSFALWHRRTNVLPEIAPLLRSLLLLTYAISVLHKCNYDFLDPEVSCASFMLEGIAARFGLPAPHLLLGKGSIWATLLLEALIPLLLLSPFRRTALLVAFLFHGLLSLHAHPGVYSFSALTLTLILLFWPNRETMTLARPNQVLAILAGAAGILLLVFHQSYWANRFGFCLWLIAAASAAISFVIHRRATTNPAPILKAWYSPACCFLLLFLANGLAPLPWPPHPQNLLHVQQPSDGGRSHQPPLDPYFFAALPLSKATSCRHGIHRLNLTSPCPKLSGDQLRQAPPHGCPRRTRQHHHLSIKRRHPPGHCRSNPAVITSG
jgi:hypothetical protein